MHNYIKYIFLYFLEEILYLYEVQINYIFYINTYYSYMYIIHK